MNNVKSMSVIEQVVKANLIDGYYSKLRHSLKTSYPAKEFTNIFFHIF